MSRSRSPGLLFWSKVAVHRFVRGMTWFWEDLCDAVRLRAGRHSVVARERCYDTSHYPYLLFRHSTPLVRDLASPGAEFQYQKEHNLRIASSRMDGMKLRPGQVLSFCRVIGETTERRGYLPALTLADSDLVPLPGGGLCQLSNMIYWIALNSGLEIVERHRHGYDLFPDSNRSIPFGCGATVFFNYVDLRLRNSMPFPVVFRFGVERGFLHGALYGKSRLPLAVEVFETDHAFYRDGPRLRRRNRLWRRIISAGLPERIEMLAENDCEVRYAVKE